MDALAAWSAIAVMTTRFVNRHKFRWIESRAPSLCHSALFNTGEITVGGGSGSRALAFQRKSQLPAYAQSAS